jgi:hypothetical protein
MIRFLFPFLMLSLPALAQDLAPLHGQWAGEGEIARGDEPPERFQCRLHLRAIDPTQTFMTGRCATAQASQSFQYMLIEEGGGALRAENRATAEDTLPPLMQGTATPGALRITDEAGALFDLRREGEGIAFTLEGVENGRPARGQARLAPRD